jgi:hypothetical protein
VIFPRPTCNVRRLHFTDLAILEQLRRYAETQQVGVVLAGPPLSPDEADVLTTIWPDLTERCYEAAERKIKQVALVFLDGYCGPGALRGPDDRLVTAPLEKCGLGLVFLPTKDTTRKLYRAVSRNHPSLRAVFESDLCSEVLGTVHSTAEVGTYLSYSRSVIGSGTNLLGVRHLVVYANAFRHIGGFTPGAVSPEAFARARAEDQLGLILQNIGRALRGEAEKTVVVFVLNAEPPLLEVLETAPAILQGSELPPVVVLGQDLDLLVEQAGSWLENGGGAWPNLTPTLKKRRGGRPKAHTKASLTEAARAAARSGETWRAFRIRTSPHRTLSDKDMEELRREFADQEM